VEGGAAAFPQAQVEAALPEVLRLLLAPAPALVFLVKEARD